MPDSKVLGNSANLAPRPLTEFPNTFESDKYSRDTVLAVSLRISDNLSLPLELVAGTVLVLERTPPDVPNPAALMPLQALERGIFRTSDRHTADPDLHEVCSVAKGPPTLAVSAP